MPETRRKLLITLMGAAGLVAAEPILWGQLTRYPMPMPSPNAPNEHVPSGLDGPQPTKSNPNTFDPETQKEVRAEVDRLYDLISDLKKQMDATDLNATLPLSVVKKAQQIEKLAKQVKEKAKG